MGNHTLPPSRKEFLIRFTLIISILLGLFLLYWSHQIFLAAVIGIGGAIILLPAISWCQIKFHLPRGPCTILVYFILLIFLGVFFYSIEKIASQQISSLIEQVPKIEKTLHTKGQEIFQKFGENGALKEQLKTIDYNKSFAAVMPKVLETFKLGLNTISMLFLALIVSFYICLSPKFYRKQVVFLFAPEEASEIESKLNRLAYITRSWFRAQVLDMGCIAVLTALGLWIVGIKYWLAVGIITGILCLMPYLGIVIASLLAVLITLADQPDKVVWVIVVQIIVQQIEGNFILPKLMRQNVSLPEVPLIIFMILMGIWFGLLGVIVAAPLLAIAIELINFARADKKRPLLKQD